MLMTNQREVIVHIGTSADGYIAWTDGNLEWLTVVLAVSVLIISVLTTSACRFLYIDRELSGPVTLNQNWLELTPPEPLTIERDTHEIALVPDPPIKMADDPAGQRSLIASDGRDATIEAELA